MDRRQGKFLEKNRTFVRTLKPRKAEREKLKAQNAELVQDNTELQGIKAYS